ncbi:MAG: phosphate acyltransferase PlsX [Pseudomonadota bacterium]
MAAKTVISIDTLGGDHAPDVVIDGLRLFAERDADTRFLLHGPGPVLEDLLNDAPALKARCETRHSEDRVKMDDKPSQALRRARGSTMWNAVEAVQSGEAQSAMSAGNTGALMAIAISLLRKMDGVHRPGMTALWPTMTGTSVVLDVGANLEADAEQLVTFAVMGEAYARAVTGKARPSIGLLNIGSEETKGHGHIRQAGELLSRPELQVDYYGFVEGDDISAGTVDVIVTDGFSGNIALKAAEGTARLVASYLRDALTRDTRSKLGALLAAPGLRALRSKMNPSNVNGGVLLGLNGLVVKSHGGADADGIATAIALATNLADSQYKEEVAAGLSRIANLAIPPAAPQAHA